MPQGPVPVAENVPRDLSPWHTGEDMIVVYEFLSEESIENIITCMNFKIDKAVFFGYESAVRSHKKVTESFIRKYCKVPQVEFITVPRDDLFETERIIRKEVEREKASASELYFDLTGGEELTLVAIGMIARDYKIPMHVYDIREGRLIDLSAGDGAGISVTGIPKYTRFDIDRFIESRGGVINYSLHKDLKSLDDPHLSEFVDKLWNVSKKYSNDWTCFSAFLREHMAPAGGLDVDRNRDTVEAALKKENSEFRSQTKLNDILEELAGIGVLCNLRIDSEKYRFTFKNELVKECLWDGGSILELHTYKNERARADDCKLGVHLDWDGIIHQRVGDDVYNEIDVMCLNGYIPTFISCKNGKMSGGTTLHALYELMAVADHFGGKYARKVLVATHPIGDVYLKRAEEMGIEVR